MADRVHPNDDPEPTATTTTSSANNPKISSKATPPAPEKPIGSYVIQIPKDQIYRAPPTENDRQYQNLTGRGKNRRTLWCCCCRSLYWILSLISTIVVFAAIVFYLVFRPETPNYSVNSISIKGLNLNSSASDLSPEFDVTIRAHNPNKKIGIYYKKRSSASIYVSNLKLCDGALPAFYQPSRNVTIFKTVLKGSGILLGSSVHQSLVNEQINNNDGKIPLKLKLKAPVKLKVGSFKTWTITVKVSCDIMVDKLTADSKIMSSNCNFSVKPW